MLTVPNYRGQAMNETLKSLDFRHLEKKLNELRIEVGCNADGKFIVCSYSEPLFCLERNSEEEAKRAVQETISSYVRTFYKELGDFKFSIGERPPVIPQQFVKPIASLRPEFERDGAQCAVA